MPIFQHKTKQKRLLVAVDIGSHALKLIAYETVSTSPYPAILFKKVEQFSSAPRPEREITVLKKMLFDVIKSLGKMPDHIYVGIDAYFAKLVSQVWGMNVDERRHLLSQKDLGLFFQNLFTEERRGEEARAAYPYGILFNGFPAISSASRVHLLSKKTVAALREIQFRVLLLQFPDRVGKLFTELSQSFGGLPLEFLPLLLAESFAYTKALGEKDFFSIDIGGESTTLGLFKDGILLETASFNQGAHHFFRAIARASGSDLGEAERGALQYIKGLIQNSHREKLQKMLFEESKKWENLFRSCLNTFYTKGPIPPRILLTGGGAYLPEIQNSIRNSQWLGTFSYTDKPELHIVEGSAIFQGNSLGGHIQGPEDFGPASLMYYGMMYEPLF